MTTAASPDRPITAPLGSRGGEPGGDPSAGQVAAAPRGALAVLSLAVFMSSLDLFIVNLAFPSISREFPRTTLASLSWVLNAYTIVFAAGLVPAGRWGDRLGRARLFRTGLVLFTVSSAACALTPSVGLLIAARVLQALGASMMVPTSLSLLLGLVPAAARAKAIGTWSAVGAMGAAFGPVVGGLLVELSWRDVFWVNVPIGAVAVVLGRRMLGDSRDPAATHRPDTLGAALLAAGVGAVALALVEGPGWGWASARVLGLLAGAVVLVGAVAMRSTRHPVPVVEPSMLGLRSFSWAFAASVVYYAGFAAFVLNGVEFLTGVWHYSAVRAGLAVAPGPLAVLPIARVVSPRLVGRLGAGRTAALGCLVNAVAQLTWLLLITEHPSYAGHLLPAQILGGIGVGLVIPSLVGAGTGDLPPQQYGAGSGVLNMARQLGSVLGVAALVAVLSGLSTSTTGSQLTVFRDAIGVLVGFFLLAGVLAAMARRTPSVTPGRRSPSVGRGDGNRPGGPGPGRHRRR